MYNLKITKEQAEILIKSLDLFARIGIGQFREVARHPSWERKWVNGEISLTQYNRARAALVNVSVALTGREESTEGIPAADEHNRIAYDIMTVIECQLKKDGHINREGCYTPIRFADHPLPSIESVNGEEE